MPDRFLDAYLARNREDRSAALARELQSQRITTEERGQNIQSHGIDVQEMAQKAQQAAEAARLAETQKNRQFIEANTGQQGIATGNLRPTQTISIPGIGQVPTEPGVNYGGQQLSAVPEVEQLRTKAKLSLEAENAQRDQYIKTANDYFDANPNFDLENPGLRQGIILHKSLGLPLPNESEDQFGARIKQSLATAMQKGLKPGDPEFNKIFTMWKLHQSEVAAKAAAAKAAMTPMATLQYQAEQAASALLPKVEAEAQSTPGFAQMDAFKQSETRRMIATKHASDPANLPTGMSPAILSETLQRLLQSMPQAAKPEPTSILDKILDPNSDFNKSLKK